MSTIFTITRNELIEAALGKLGVLARGQTPDTEDYTKGALALKTLIGFFKTKGLFLWKRTSLTIVPTPGISSYEIGVGKNLSTPFPVKIEDAYSSYVTGFQNIPIDIISEMEYNRLPTNTSSGMPLKMAYTPKIDSGVIKIWPTPDAIASANYRFSIVYQEAFQHPETGTDVLDFPEEWFLPIVYKLAVLLAPEWGIPLEDRNMLKAEAKEYLEAVDGFGIEDASLFFSPKRQ